MADDIIDARIRVPHGYRIDAVHLSRPGAWPIQVVPESAVIVESSPLFEVGKTYRTRGGDLAAIGEVTEAYLIGTINGRPELWSWLRNGRINACQGSDNQMDLMPGAIEMDVPVLVTMKVLREHLDRECAEREAHLTEVLERLDRFAIELAGKANAFFKPVPPSDPNKRTIKGGWLNVYRSKDGAACVGSLHEDRAEADRRASDTRELPRIACIQIPDIAEGQGL